MKKMKYIMVISFMSVISIVSAQTRDTIPQINKKVNPKIERNSIRKGNTLYEGEKFTESEIEYRKALDANPDILVRYL